MLTARLDLSTTDRLFATLFSGALGSAAVALLFLVIDALRGDPFFTPSLMGSVILFGATPDPGLAVRMDSVAMYSIAHFGAFALLGAVLTELYARLDDPARLPPVVGVAAFALLSAGTAVLDGLLFPSLIAAIGPVSVALANATASGVMAWFIHASLSEAVLRPTPAESRVRQRLASSSSN